MNKILLAILALFFTGNISAATATQSATPIYQLGNIEATFIQVPLTYEIYRYARYSDLRDLRVLDGEHNPLPYQLVSVNPGTPETKIITNTLAFFPVAVDATPDTLRKLYTSQTRVSGDRIQIATSDHLLDSENPEFYLIDISKVDHAITSLSIDWEEQAANQYLEIELEATRNLQDWFSLGRATLVQLSQPGEQEQQSQHGKKIQQLKHNQINVDIAKKDYEFLRLKIVRGAEQLHITRIEAQHRIKYSSDQKAKGETWNISGQLAQVQTSLYFANSRSTIQSVSAWEFIRNEVTPVESLSINLGSNIYGDLINIFSRNTEKQDWRMVYQGVWFNAQVGEAWRSSEAIKIYPNGDKFWRVELNESAKDFQAPALVFSWQPLQLQVVTNNKPPFSVAVSNEYNIDKNNAQVFRQIVGASSPKWISTHLIKLNVQPEALVAEETKVDWKRLIFWAALVAAVIVLLIFSLKLFKQLKVSDIRE